ncbi:hypothetical protein ACWGKA_04910 [Streptomyces luteogriseus]
MTHLVTHHLEGTARAPVGLVLLDACPITPDGRGEDWLLCPAAPPPQEPAPRAGHGADAAPPGVAPYARHARLRGGLDGWTARRL